MGSDTRVARSYSRRSTASLRSVRASSASRALYVAQSATHLFMRLDLWENVNTNFGNGPIDEEYGRYALELASDAPIDHMFLGIAFDRDGGVWSLGHNGASAEAPAVLEGPSFVSVAGSVIEFGASLDLIGNPSVFTEVRAESATTDDQELDGIGKTCVPG